MVENFLMGAGAKLVNNVAVTWMENQREERKFNALKDDKLIKAHIQLAELNQKHWITSTSRAIIFILLTLAWCWMGIAGLTGMEVDSSAIVPAKTGVLARVFGGAELKVLNIKGSTLLYQWYQIMEMMMGAFVMKRR